MPENNFTHHKKEDNRIWVTVIVAVIALAVGFAGGYYAKGGSKNSATQAANTSRSAGNFPGGGFGGAQRSMNAGTVTAISSTSITINNTQTSQSQTFSITSSTTVTDSGSASSVGDIAVGDTVAIIPDTTTTTQADRILVNPSFGNFQPQSDGSSGSSSSGTNGT